MAVAGRSARAEYQRRRQRDRRIIPQNLRLTIPVVLITPIVVYLAVRLGCHTINSVFNHIGTSTTGGRTDASVPVVSTKLANLLGIVVALAATVGLAAEFWAPRRSTEAWRIGSEGEEALGAVLDRLTSQGYRVLHDLAIPGSKANIDHVVVGPTGVYVIDPKNYSGHITFSKGTLWHGRYPVTKKLAATRWEAQQVARCVGPEVKVAPVMCVLGASMPKESMQVDGVHVVAGHRRLTKGILARPVLLTPGEVDELSDRIGRKLPDLSG